MLTTQTALITRLFPGATKGRPVSDTSNAGWVNESGGTSNLYASIDEQVLDDNDKILSPQVAGTRAVRFKLDAVIDPASSTGHVLRYRARREGNGSADMTVRLVQGSSTVIASWSHTGLGTSFTTFAQQLSGAQADAITNYADLYIEFEKTAP